MFFQFLTAVVFNTCLQEIAKKDFITDRSGLELGAEVNVERWLISRG